MADILDVFGFGNLAPGRGSIIGGFPVPGDFSIGGILTDIVQRFPIPIPRPRLPGPRVPAPAPRGPGRIPIPVPIPDIFGIFNGGSDCPTGAANPCCRGQHLDKATSTKCVSNRRMNPLNSRALKRATRRLKGFERAVKGTRKQLRSLAKI